MSEIIKKQQDFESEYYTWFDSGLKQHLDDNRRRYRMDVEDKEEREARGLSALPSTKSTSVVDSAVERALLDYHSDPESITFTSKSVDDPNKDMFAAWLTKVFQYRAAHTFPFFTWHNASLTAAFTDGLEAAMVSWKKEAYTKKITKYVDLLAGQEVEPTIFRQASKLDPNRFKKQDIEQEVIVKDTWWIDQLRPGAELLWDFKIPYLDINLGEVALVKLYRSVDEILKMADAGIIDKIKREDVVQHQATGQTTRFNSDTTLTTVDPNYISLGTYDKVELRVFFEKIDCQWYVSFILGNSVLLNKEPKLVNDIFFGGREVNRLPIVLGTTKLKLWEKIGRGLPETIAPIEDEWMEHRNNLNDAAKIAIQGRVRIEPDSDVYIDDVLNARAFRARAGDVEFMTNQNMSIIENLRASDSLASDMNELIPVGMSSRGLVPKGTDKTLGAVQMATQQSQDKLSVQLMVRNETFFKQLLWLIAQLEFAYETDETILKIAGKQANIQPPQTLLDGKPGIDLSVFDFDIDIQINAGMGSVPRSQKLNNLVQIVNSAKMLGKPLDVDAIFNQGLILLGYTPGQFDPKEPPMPAPPVVDYKLDIKTTLPELIALDPTIPQMLIQKWKEGQVETNTTAESAGLANEIAHNGNPNPAGNSAMDMTTGSAAMGMSQGGQGGY